MLAKFKVEHYKSLFDTEIDLEPLTVFIGPNGSGKSNICEALVVLSDFLTRLVDSETTASAKDFFSQSLSAISKNRSNIESKFWHGKLDYLSLTVITFGKGERDVLKPTDTSVKFNYQEQNIIIDILGGDSNRSVYVLIKKLSYFQ